MPELCQATDSLRNALLPYRAVIKRCFTQGLTVDQCAAYLVYVEQKSHTFSIELLTSRAGKRAIREVFWMDHLDEPEATFEKVLGIAHHPSGNWRSIVAFMYEHRPSLFSWIPAAYRAKVEAILGCPIEPMGPAADPLQTP